LPTALARRPTGDIQLNSIELQQHESGIRVVRL
jgi:hypothetical protein